MSTDQRIQDLEIKVRSLENENRILRANVWDGYFKAACQATLHHGAKTGVAAAVEVADLMLAARQKRFSLEVTSQIDQALDQVGQADYPVNQAKQSQEVVGSEHREAPIVEIGLDSAVTTSEILPAEFHYMKKGGA